MNDIVYNTLNRQKKELNQLLKIESVARSFLPEVVKSLKSPLVKVLLGPRRAGKSTLALEALSGKNFAYVNFEDEGFASDINGDHLLKCIQQVYGKTDYFYFDEIQNMDRWEKFIHRLHREGYNCLVTGSNSKLLSEEFATALTGRHVAFELLPFSFAEATKAWGDSSKERFDTYLTQGGFPEVVLGRVEFSSYLKTLWDSVVLKDIVQRKKIRQVAALNDFLSLALASVSARSTYDSFKRGMHGLVSGPTIKNFLHYAEQAYLLCQLECFYASARKRIKSERKIYTYDNGFFSARRVSVTADLGRLLENLVFQELVRRGFKPNLDLFYYQTSDGYEIDFLLRKGHLTVGLLQVCFDMSTTRTREREIRALQKAAKEFELKNVEIISYDLREQIKDNGTTIDVIPAYEWLLSGN